MCLPVGGPGPSSERVHLNGFLVGLDTVLGYSSGGLGYSFERVHLNGCAGVLNSWQLLQQNGQGFARDFQFARDVCKNDVRRATHNIMLT